MNFVSNMKIGNKIALILGVNLFLLIGLSGLSLWGTHRSDELSAEVQDRYAKSLLLELVTGETAAIGQTVARMIGGSSQLEEVLADLNASRKARQAALDEYSSSLKTPKDSQEAAELKQLIQSNVAANDAIVQSLKTNQYGAISEEYKHSTEVSLMVRAKAKEAQQTQSDLRLATEKRQKAGSQTIWYLLMIGTAIAGVITISGAVVLTRSIAAPLSAAVQHLDQIAAGDLSKDADSEFAARGDEIGVLARAMHTMTVALRKMIKEVSGGIEVLANSSTQLMASSGEMTSGSRHASDKAHSVSAAAEEMSSNITSVAVGMEQTTANLTHVAAATEEMTTTIGQIARNSEKARTITDEATRQAARITEQINQLGAAAREIGKVTETITEISSQTNLLALNATIEAARAGNAGKGFAVVATEIKALAQQTAAATEDIRNRIAGVQAATAGGIGEIEKISGVIVEVNSIVASIAAAIEEQSVTTKNIARNIAEASAGVADANTRVAESSHVSREIAKDIVDVDHAAGEMASGSDHVRGSAAELSNVAEELRLTVARFHA